MASKYFWRGVLIIALGVVSRAYFAFLLMMSLFGRVLVARRQENLPPRSFRDNECFPATDTVLPMNRRPWPSTHGAFSIARFDLTSQNCDLPLPMLISKIVRQAASVIAFCISWLDFTLGERPGDIPRGYYHYPAIHGDTIIFTSEGDLWSVSVQGGSGAQCRRVVDFRECCHRISNRLGLGSQKRSRSTDSDRLCHSAAQA